MNKQDVLQLRKMRNEAFIVHQWSMPPHIRKSRCSRVWFMQKWRGYRKQVEEYGIPSDGNEVR